RKLSEGAPGFVERRQLGAAAVNVEAVAEFQGVSSVNRTRGVIGKGCAHPAVVADVKVRWMIGVGGMVHQRDAFCGAGFDGTGVVDPAGAFPKDVGFVNAALGIANLAPTV